MKWAVLLAKEREITIHADNINEVVKEANSIKTTEERIVNIRLQRGGEVRQPAGLITRRLTVRIRSLLFKRSKLKNGSLSERI